MLLRNILSSFRIALRHYSKTAPKPISIDENILKDIENEIYKPRKHPGVMKTKTVVVPDNFVKAVLSAIEDFPMKALLETCNNLSKHLKGRVPPMEKSEYLEKVHTIQERITSKNQNYEIKCEEDEKKYKQMIKDKVNNVIREKVYNWKPMTYDVYHSLAYLLTRAAPEYAVLIRIFGEIVDRDPSFHPKTFFDFGSGVGTGTWAAHAYWKNNIFEYFNVDASSDMNDLAQILIQGGRGTGIPVIKGTFYRQFLPSSNIGYDLVISAYSLLELPSLEARLQTVLNLWHKTQHYLVVVEQGTNAGFKVVNEIRDFILQHETRRGYVFSPCPHDVVCPRFVASDGTPCNFEAPYLTMPIGKKSEFQREKYSYIVLKKGKRPDDENWPRIVRPTLVRSKHTICRLCNGCGELEEIIFTAKRHGKTTYHCARSSRWGDLLPLKNT